MNGGSPRTVRRPGLAAATIDTLMRSDSRIVITGASGWLGSATIELLHDALGGALLQRLRCFGSSARMLAFRDGLSIEQRPLEEISALPLCPTIVLHFAFLTKDRVEGMDGAAYIAANVALSTMVLDALDAIGTSAVFVASSGAAYSADDPSADAALRLYGSLKQRDEEAFAHWARTRHRTVVIARVFNVSGPYINKPRSYALAALINDALAGRPVTVRALHPVVRGFVAIREVMSLVFCLMDSAEPHVLRFDTGGDPMELGEVAKRVAATLGAASTLRAVITSERTDRYVGDRTAYDGLRNNYGIDAISFHDQILETADYLSDNLAGT